MQIDGTVALVTGGASGLGLATVRELHGRGASVVIVDLPSSSGKEVAAELGDRVVFAAGDVTDGGRRDRPRSPPPTALGDARGSR